MADSVVLFTIDGSGHLPAAVELSKILSRRGLAVTIVTPFTNAAPSGVPSVSIHVLPPPRDAAAAPPSHPLIQILNSVRDACDGFVAYLRSLPAAPRAVIVNWFCTDGIAAARRAGIPAYVFFTSNASVLASSLYLPTADAGIDPGISFAAMGDALVRFPGRLHPVKAADMPNASLGRDCELHRRTMEQLTRLADADGFLVNTFEWLEPGALKAMRDGVCLPGRPTPPVYCVGPLIADGEAPRAGGECLAWLDMQPERSVVFLCFGSRGVFPAAQLKEIAAGLERSGHRFLWAVRPPSPAPAEETLFPCGFLEKTKEKGKVVSTWVPQTAVLRHPAVALFVTHCGWNSVLEAVAAGVPMVCWPLYAEQRMNKTFMVAEMRIGVEMEGYDKETVTAGEVEATVRRAMESDCGKELRKRAAIGKEMAAAAVADGGSSYNATLQWVNKVKKAPSAAMQSAAAPAFNWAGAGEGRLQKIALEN